jgi:hypothetical protein
MTREKMTTETVILIAIFAGLAIAAGAIFVAKATNINCTPRTEEDLTGQTCGHGALLLVSLPVT